MTRNLDAYSNEYLRQPFEPVMIRYRRKKTVEWLGDTRQLSILEIGCGISPAFDWIQHWRWLSLLEPATEFASRIHEQMQHHPSVDLITATLESNPAFPHAPFDIILLNSLLHELQDPASALKSLHHWAHPQTRIFINVPNALSVHRRLAVHMGLIPSPDTLSDFNHLFQQARVFTPATLQSLAEQCGYRILRQETAFIKPFTHAQMQTWMDAGILTDTLLEGLYRVSPEMPDAGAEIFMELQPIANPGSQ
ncbi:MAG: class I SAM-dependent methyltransferase [Bacteroidia bacterium]|nr:class I SAM-dependent methyltransferase [Bacteroidia bacterium]